MKYNLVYKRFTSTSILISWPELIDEVVLQDILTFKLQIEHNKSNHVVSCVNAYNTLVVYYKVLDNFTKVVEGLKVLYNSQKLTLLPKAANKLWRIPVCYDTCFGLDLSLMAQQKNITVNAIVRRHVEAVYTVYFIGFLPGFLYLGGLDAVLNTPRKTTPRLHVQKGAVAIGGAQTGVYPSSSPGGWHIIGNSPIRFFDVTKDIPCFAKPGDKIMFYPVSLKTHKDISILVEAGVYNLDYELL